MTYKSIENKMLSGYMPGGFAAVTRDQVIDFLVQLFKVNACTPSRWRQADRIPERRAQELVRLFPEFGEE